MQTKAELVKRKEEFFSISMNIDGAFLFHAR